MIDPGTNVKRAQDRQAMSALLRSVPKEMWQSLGRHKTVKEAWEAVRTMRVGADRVKEVNAQKLLKEFENNGFKEGLRHADHQSRHQPQDARGDGG